MAEAARESRQGTVPPAITVRGRALRAAKQFVAGTHRCVAPEQTWEFIRPRLRRAGITRVADLTGLDHVGVTTATAIRPNGRSLFRRDRPEAWVLGWDLLQERETWLPWVSVAMTYRPKPEPRMEMAMPMTSNGLASGNHLLEAVCSALYEVIERDAVSWQLC